MLPTDLRTVQSDPWFGSISPTSGQMLLDNATVRVFEENTRVYRVEDLPNGLHVLLSGEVRLVAYPVPGVELVGKIIRPGNWFGELSVLDGKGRPHDAVAVTSSRVATVDMVMVESLTRNRPVVWREIAMLSCLHQRAGLRDTGRIRTEPARARVARFLAAAAKSSSDGQVSMTQDQMAQVTGISRQHLNTIIRELQDLGIVKARYAGLGILNHPRLREFIDSQDRSLS